MRLIGRSHKETAVNRHVPAAAIAAVLCLTSLTPTRATSFDFDAMTIADINRAFDRGALTAERLVQLCLARIEVGASELHRFIENGIAAKVAEELKKIGYNHVTLDLQGYRRGNLHEQFPQRLGQPS